jgi:NAD(P)-dependent dehydrogenase (short-subunit alcohol dehydrogenase family)
MLSTLFMEADMENCMKTFSLAGRVIVTTGAAGLLGQMHTRAVLDAGGVPVMLDIDGDRLKLAVSGLQKEYGEKPILSYAHSVTDKAQMTRVLSDIIAQRSALHGLINNACNNPTMKDSPLGEGQLETFGYDEWRQDLDVGLYGAMCCSQVFGGYMAAHGGGVIVNIVSDLGLVAPNQNLYHIEGKPAEEQPKKPVTYSVVKWGLIGLTKYLSTYWAKEKVRANAIALGGVYHHQNDVFLSRISQLIPMGRMAEKSEYMGSIVYLLSDASAYMTGSVVTVDGGRTAW